MTATAVRVTGLSHIGAVREENQDAIYLPAPADPAILAGPDSLLAIADGMGGHAKGGLASTVAIETFRSAFHEQPAHAPMPALRRAMELANLAVYQTALRLNVGQMGTTLTAAYLSGNHLYLAHLGDTRAYLIRGGRARCLTNDHSVAGELARMRIISPDKIRRHHQRSVLSKTLGMNLFVRADHSHLALQPGDIVVLCSDGLWAYVEDDELAGLAARTGEASELSQALVDLALERQTDDNASVVVAHVERLAAPPAAVPAVPRGWGRVAALFGRPR
jgi:protein phosphatase